MEITQINQNQNKTVFKEGDMLEIIASLWRENPSRDLKTELFVRTV